MHNIDSQINALMEILYKCIQNEQLCHRSTPLLKMCSDEIIVKCMKRIAEKENLSEYATKISGTGKKGDGYFSNIILVTLTGKTTTSDTKTWNLVIKMSTTNTVTRSKLPIKQIFETECHIYDQVVPAFQKFRNEFVKKNQPLDFILTCHTTGFLENCEVLIFENLITKGFTLWNRHKPMTYEHAKLVLRAYGQWHATSLALRQKQPENFEKLVKNKIHTSNCFSLAIGVDGMIYQQFEQLYNAWETDLEIKKFKFDKDEITYIFSDLFAEEPNYHVILHGDSWNNNFMFKSDEQTKQPTNLYIIDWQCSAVGSPILDLSYFIYACVDTEIYTDVKELLKIYYDSLSENLREFQCDPLQVISFEKVLEHWKKFSKYGLLLGSYLLKFSLSEIDEVPGLMKIIENGHQLGNNFNVKIINEEIFLRRVRSNILHYLRNLSAT